MENNLGTFAREAPKYWALNLPVTPVRHRTKGACMDNWNIIGVPDASTQAEWLKRYGDYGIGLVTGQEIFPDELLISVDVDMRSDNFVGAVQVILGEGIISAKFGAKGRTFNVRAFAKIKSQAFSAPDGERVIDILGPGKMSVMPGTLHKDTGQPYEWRGEPLTEVDLSRLPYVCERKLAILRALSTSEYTFLVMGGQATHSPGVALTAVLVSADAHDDEIHAIFKALLPEGYTGNSLDELQGWIDSARKKFKQVASAKSGRMDLLKEMETSLSAIDLFKDSEGNAYLSFMNHNGAVMTHLLNSRGAKDWLRMACYKATSKAIKGEALKELVGLLEARAIHEGETHEVHLRIGEYNDVIYIDCGDDKGSVVHIDAEGWRVQNDSPIKFLRPQGYKAMRLPEAGGSIDQLRILLGIETSAWPLVLAFLISAYHPHGPYFHLMIEGEHGSGKSFTTSTLKSLVDPSTAMRTMLPKNERDLMVMAKASRMLAFDNMSYIQSGISDALCVLSTGGGLVVRGLFTNAEPYIFQQTRPVIMNGITSMIHRPDLMDRTIPVFLSAIPEGKRRPEEDLKADLEAQLPQILGGLFNILSTALRNKEEIIAPTNLRMADCAKWLKAAEPATSLPEDTLVDAVWHSQKDCVAEQMVTHPLVAALSVVVETGPFDGYVGALHARVVAGYDFKDKEMIGQTAAHFSNVLKRFKSSLATVGIHYELGEKDKKGKPIKVWRDEQGV